MREWIRSLPKAELHVHLEGSVEPETLCEMDPALGVGEARAGYAFEDFPGFLQSFAFVAKRLRDPVHYGLAARRLLERLHSEGVQHAEIILSAGVVLWKGLDFSAVWNALVRECARSPVRVAWNLDAVRHWGVEKSWDVVRLAAERRDEGAISFGLGGDEAGGPARQFQDVFAFARDQGLRLTCHAGETCGPQSVWDALAIGAERIGHGIRSIEDAALVRHLAANQIPLEISILSNLRTRAVLSLEQHPVRKLFDAGVAVTLNTDDPALFGNCLADEYETAARTFGFTQEELRQIAANGFRYAFARTAAAGATTSGE